MNCLANLSYTDHSTLEFPACQGSFLIIYVGTHTQFRRRPDTVQPLIRLKV
jgi:hypothetical protein